MAFNLTFDVIELARLQSSITGVLAGFALTVAILLMGQRVEGASVGKYDAGIEQAAVMVFVTAAFSGVLASFLFALMGSEMVNSGRAFMMLISAGFVFTLSAVELTPKSWTLFRRFLVQTRWPEHAPTPLRLELGWDEMAQRRMDALVHIYVIQEGGGHRSRPRFHS